MFRTVSATEKDNGYNMYVITVWIDCTQNNHEGANIYIYMGFHGDLSRLSLIGI